MKIHKILLLLLLTLNIYAKDEQITINFKDLLVSDYLKLTAKILDKNILISTPIKGKVEFISNKPVYKKDLLNLTNFILESKGLTIIENEGILRVVKLNDAVKYNVPVFNNSKKINDNFKMVTEVFNVEFTNVDYVSSKIRHLISKSAKLVTDKESNAIILTDFPSNISTIKDVISFIAKDSKKYIETVKLENIQGSSILTDLKAVSKSIFNEEIEKERVEILLNKDTNSIMFVGKQQNVAFMIEYLKSIDKNGSLVEKVVEVVYLKNIEAKNIINILSGIISQKTYKEKSEKPFASIDEESNSIILMGPKKELEYFTQLIEKLDRDRQQVYVKARIIEVSELKTKDIGIKYGLLAGKNTNKGLLTMATSLGGEAISVDPGSLGLSIPSLTESFALGATISLLNENGAADIVSEPSLLCLNNKESSIYVGETRSIKTGTTTTSGGNVNDTYKREDIGLTLKVKPRISNGNKVLLELSTILEDVAQTTTNDQPNTSKKNLITTAIVNNGESVILGGYIKEKSENSVTSIPLLGDIPILGHMFRDTSKVTDKINLVIIITPYIVPKTKDLTYIRNQLGKLKLLEEEFTQETIKKLEKKKDIEVINKQDTAVYSRDILRDR